MNYDGYGQDPYLYDIYLKRQNDKREIRRIGLLTGAALLLFIVIQNIAVALLSLFGLYGKYLNDPVFQVGFDMIVSVAGMYVPFMAFGRLIKKRTGISDCTPLGKPTDAALTALAIPAGLGICMAANLVTSFIVIYMQFFGLKLSSPELAQPSGAAGFLLSVIRVSVAAGLVEELTFRGYVMQPLRKYGDSFAIVMAAFTFGLMHGNLVQAPFALIVGIGLGYITVKTNSLWPAIIIHALNNFISTSVSYMLDYIGNEQLVNTIYAVIVYGFIIVGTVCLAAFAMRARRITPRYTGSSALSSGEKLTAYLFNPTMVAAIIFMLYCTMRYVTRTVR